MRADIISWCHACLPCATRSVGKSVRPPLRPIPVGFAYRMMQQASTGESPFFLLYGHDPQLPSEVALTPPVSRENVHLDDYKSSMLRAMREIGSTNTGEGPEKTEASA